MDYPYCVKKKQLWIVWLQKNILKHTQIIVLTNLEYNYNCTHTHINLAELSLEQQTSQPCLSSTESNYLHTFSICPMKLICHVCNSLYSVDCSSFCFAVLLTLSLPLPLILSQPRGLPAIAPPVHQHRGQEGGIYADIWTVIPTTHTVCQCTAGSSLQQAHTPVPKLRTLLPYGQEIRLTSQ